MEAKTNRETALLVIDVQQGLFHKSTPIYQADELLMKINCLIDQAREAGVPVIFIQHSSEKVLPAGSADWQLHPDLHTLVGDQIVHKTHPNAFDDTDLAAILSERGINHLVLTGLVTHGCVKSTCLGALELHYEVTLVSDCHSSFSPKADQMINEWNENLKLKGAGLLPARDVMFSG
jgi:nicotinamidase-related amidase